MATVKLTKSIRERLERMLLEHRFEGDVEKIIRRQQAFAQRLYEDIYSAGERALMESLPLGWLPHLSQLTVGPYGKEHGNMLVVNLDGRGGIYHELAVAAPSYEKTRPSVPFVRVPHRHHHGCMKVYRAIDPLMQEHDQLKNDREDLHTRVKEAAAVIRSTLESVTTIGALVSNWPEVEPFTRRWTEAVSRNLPAVPAARLNAILDLPVEDVAQPADEDA